MRVEKGERFKRVNEDEPYRYEFMWFSNGCREDRKATLKNCETGLVFVVHEKEFNKWYEPEELKTLAKRHVYKGEFIRGLEDGEIYRCTKEEWCDPWEFCHWEFENVKTGEELVISDDDKSGIKDKYCAVAAPGKFKESRVYENVFQLYAHVEPFVMGEIDMEEDKFKKWVKELKGFHGSFVRADLDGFREDLVGKITVLLQRVGVKLRWKLREEDGDVCAGGVPEFAGNNEWRYVQRWYYHMSLFYLLN